MNSTDFAIGLLLGALFLMILSLVSYHGINLATLDAAITSVAVTMLLLAAIAIVRSRMQ